MHSNKLLHESSPYLLQHAHNPVEWYPWGDQAFEKAKKEDKLILVSIGYSACHWCHVMEHESFEDEDVAAIMNQHFVCIKVDREERPDVDKIYMEAVQMMTGRGGWPLNCFALPDGRPVWGGTYFPKTQWVDVLQKLAVLYQSDKAKLELQASQLTTGLQKADFPEMNLNNDYSNVIESINNSVHSFDTTYGGFGEAPKFPMPISLKLLVNVGYNTHNKTLLDFVYLTLDKMALGGIYDQAGGGFARYSVDSQWFTPHFEKMLYDNAQLMSLYSDAWKVNPKPLYKHVVEQTYDFINRELTTPQGTFYSALDADSEGEEGKFYTWTTDELIQIIGQDKVFFDYYHITQNGNWEHGRNILHAQETILDFAKTHKLVLETVEKSIAENLQKLMGVRATRIRPGLDDKSLTAWNALMIKGLTDAYQAFGEEKYLITAQKAMDELLKEVLLPDGKLHRTTKNGISKIDGFLDDYSFTIDALLGLYEVSFDEKYISIAQSLTSYTLTHFYDEGAGIFFYTSALGEQLVARKSDVQDNVIPSSVGCMANNLFRLSQLKTNEHYDDIANRLVAKMQYTACENPRYYAQWALLAYLKQTGRTEIAITGTEASTYRETLQKHFVPGVIYAGSANGKTTLELLQNRYKKGETLIYKCVNRSCELPVSNTNSVFKE